MPRLKRFLTDDGVGHLLQLANKKSVNGNKAVAGALGIHVRTYQNLVSAEKDQSSISPQVETKLKALGFTQQNLSLYTSSQRIYETKGLAHRARRSVADAPLADIHALPQKPEQRIQLYKTWREAIAKYDAPEALALSKEGQKALQKSLPIDLAPLRTLLRTIGMHKWEFALPMDTGEFANKYSSAHSRQFRTEVFESLTHFLAGAGEPQKERINEELKSVTDYLCEEELLRTGEVADLAFVPGYRSHLRAELAGTLFSKGLVRKIYLSGHSPYYAKNEARPLPLTEALAMAVYLTDVRSEFGITWDHLVVETGAHCTHQNVNFSERAFAELAAKEHGSLTVLIVTSPYHLRRTWLMMQRLALRRPNIVGAVRRVAADTRAGLGKHEWHTNQDGVTAYMTEYWKIHGGRVVGEF